MASQDRRADVTILVKPVDGPWERLGSSISRGIVPEGVSVSANESGPDTCSFSLRRRAAAPWPDLTTYNQCQILIDGNSVWGGRIWEAPLSDGGDDVIAVQGRGWQYHLDDDLLSKYWVHTNMSDYGDTRRFPTANLSISQATGLVTSEGGAMVFGWPNNTEIINNTAVGVTFDLGPDRTAKRIVITFDKVNPNPFCDFYARTHNTSDPHSGSMTDAISTSFNTISSPVAGTFSTARRYVSLFLYRDDGLTSTSTSDHLMRILTIKVFTATAYESGNASILKASDVVEDVLSSGALPLLDSSTEKIEATSFSIPDFAPQGYQTPRAIMTAANAYEGNLLGVDANGQLYYRERDTTPLVEVGEWAGSQFQDSSTGSGETLYNQVLVQGTDGAGQPVSELRTLDSSLLDAQGFNRTAVLSVGSVVTTASAQALGDVWLADKSSPKLKGTLTVVGPGGARRIAGGVGIHPSELLLRVGQLIRLPLVDPATGDWGRDGTIKSVSYNHDSETATVELDNERGRFESMLSRLDVVTAQAVR